MFFSFVCLFVCLLTIKGFFPWTEEGAFISALDYQLPILRSTVGYLLDQESAILSEQTLSTMQINSNCKDMGKCKGKSLIRERRVPISLGALLIVLAILLIKKYNILSYSQSFTFLGARNFGSENNINNNRIFSNFEFDPAERFNYEKNFKYAGAIVIVLIIMASLAIAL